MSLFLLCSVKSDIPDCTRCADAIRDYPILFAWIRLLFLLLYKKVNITPPGKARAYVLMLAQKYEILPCLRNCLFMAHNSGINSAFVSSQWGEGSDFPAQTLWPWFCIFGVCRCCGGSRGPTAPSMERCCSHLQMGCSRPRGEAHDKSVRDKLAGMLTCWHEVSVDMSCGTQANLPLRCEQKVAAGVPARGACPSVSSDWNSSPYQGRTLLEGHSGNEMFMAIEYIFLLFSDAVAPGKAIFNTSLVYRGICACSGVSGLNSGKFGPTQLFPSSNFPQSHEDMSLSV